MPENEAIVIPCVKGELLKFSGGLFRYKYICETCGRMFVESCPEVSAPAICHQCLNINRGNSVPVEDEK